MGTSGKRKTYEEIDPTKPLSIEDFRQLFEDKLPLNEEEKQSLNIYYEMYETFLRCEVEPVKSWITIRNIFAVKNQQIADRLKDLTTSY